ncbi:hypothetical protein MKX01_010143 [Papaver californicum]|nr:hypothetical protein MKX01_010143 [Papaver californicum]
MAFLCSTRRLLLLFLISSVALSFIISLERSKSLTHVYEYKSNGWLRECSKWDDLNRDGKAFADDVAVDEEGNAYVTDAKESKIWKVGVNGELLSIIKSPLFTFKEWYENLIGLNGIVYHPDGFLLVIHTVNGALCKINTKTEEVKLVKLVGGGSLRFGDGLELLDSSRLIVAGNPSARLVESLVGPLHRVATSATVKDGKVYLNHLVGFGIPNRKHNLVEAVFKPVR